MTTVHIQPIANASCPKACNTSRQRFDSDAGDSIGFISEDCYASRYANERHAQKCSEEPSVLSFGHAIESLVKCGWNDFVVAMSVAG
jgi:hypothetical protein